MSNTTVLITIASLSLVVSSATLTIVIIAGRKVLKVKEKAEADVENMRKKANDSLANIKAAINGIEI